MLDQNQRTSVLELHRQGHGVRTIARVLHLSRGAVRDVLKAGTATVPALARKEKADPYVDDIRDLYALCKGNLVRVHEELRSRGAAFSYQALTGFCRRHGIGTEPVKPAGEYHFAPAAEMQHDTSPHQVTIGGHVRAVQTASLVLCYSRLIYIQLYPSFTRFWCKVFLTDALHYVGGVCETCMIDNTHVVVLHGTGAEMVPVPEMEAFAERFGFTFRAHEKGDANRSARVERPFDFIEKNFFAGRTFADWADLNRQAVEWCDKVNETFSRHLHGSRRDLFATERPHLAALPVWIPPVYQLHHRIVDTAGYVHVQGPRYSVPYALIGRQVEIRETKTTIDIYQGPRLVASHAKLLDEVHGCVTAPEHRPQRGEPRPPREPLPDEVTILRLEPQVGPYLTALKAHAAGRVPRLLRRLLGMVREYPRAPLLAAIQAATAYGLYDLDRLDRMILKRIAHDYFVVPPVGEDDDDR
ncbi:MAG: IS21 family transposase [Acidobacteria bacterium]|nr:IS21 family transposase [Acidobacteriota bacterium]